MIPIVNPTNKATIKRDSRTILDAVYGVIQSNIDVIDVIEIQGHTDAVGKARSNQALSGKRAEAVKQYLINKGVDENRVRLYSNGYGESQPLEDCGQRYTHTPANDLCHENNRRVVFSTEYTVPTQ